MATKQCSSSKMTRFKAFVVAAEMSRVAPAVCARTHALTSQVSLTTATFYILALRRSEEAHLHWPFAGWIWPRTAITMERVKLQFYVAFRATWVVHSHPYSLDNAFSVHCRVTGETRRVSTSIVDKPVAYLLDARFALWMLELPDRCHDIEKQIVGIFAPSLFIYYPPIGTSNLRPSVRPRIATYDVTSTGVPHRSICKIFWASLFPAGCAIIFFFDHSRKNFQDFETPAIVVTRM